MNYYNDFDHKAAAWLQVLIDEKQIPNGHIDTRSITDVSANDLEGFTQCHFFAGIAGWPLALKLAGWPEDREVWTGSCPCQPFSVGSNDRQQGVSDARHLWPNWSKLIAARKPSIIFGEQVENAVKHGWLDEVFRDLEKCGYNTGAAVLPASSVQTDHERMRLFWLADSECQGRQRHIYEQRILGCSRKALAIACDDFDIARHQMVSNSDGVLPFNGLSVGMARSFVKGYGNAIVPQVAAQFIIASQ